MSANLERQNDEIMALQCLLPDGVFIPVSIDTPPYQFQFKFTDRAFYDSSEPQYSPLLLHFILPAEYPTLNHKAEGRPFLKFSYLELPTRTQNISTLSRWLDSPTQRRIIQLLIKTCQSSGGAEVLYEFYDALTQFLLPFYPTSIGVYKNRSDLLSDAINTSNYTNDEEYCTNGNNDENDYDNDHVDDDDDEQFNPLMNHLCHANTEVNNTSSTLTEFTTHDLEARLQGKPYKSPNFNLSRDDVMNILHTKYKCVEAERFVVKKNIFHTFCVPCSSGQEVIDVMSLFYSLKLFITSHHNMLVYRYVDPTGKVIIGSDEDGEQGAGLKQEHVISRYDCSCLVVVTRHFSGILLGPSRFKIIANLTQQVLDLCGYTRLNVKK